MTIRTNSRTWKNSASYFVSIFASKEGSFISAKLILICSDRAMKFVINDFLERTKTSDETIIEVPYSKEQGVTTPNKAIQKAIELFKNEIKSN